MSIDLLKRLAWRVNFNAAPAEAAGAMD